MKILFVGSNPSTKNIDAAIPFKGTKSAAVLDEWIKYLELTHCQFINIFDEITPGNKSLTRTQIKKSVVSLSTKIKDIEYDKIIALGKSASVALKLLKIPHYAMFHPSPKNRKLNDKAEVTATLDKCKVYIYGS